MLRLNLGRGDNIRREYNEEGGRDAIDHSCDTHDMKVPSPCEPFGEPSAVTSCQEKGSTEASCETSDQNYFLVKVHVKLQMNLLFI